MIFVPGGRTPGVNSRLRDRVGTGAALLAGTLVGVALAMPALPRTLPVVGVTISPVGAALLAGTVAVVAIPLGVALLYVVSMELER